MPVVLGQNLIDKLVPVVDRLRAQLYPSMGLQQYDVALIRRRWDGGERGLGMPTVTSCITLSPPPVIGDGVSYDLRDSGLTETGTITLSEISLTYSEADLTGQPIGDDEELIYRVTDARGQGIGPAYYTVAEPPFPDRAKAIGWSLKLKRISATENRSRMP